MLPEGGKQRQSRREERRQLVEGDGRGEGRRGGLEA